MSARWTRFIGIITVSAGLLVAQGPGGPRGRGPGQPPQGAPGDRSPEQFQQRRLDFLTTVLGLTDSQKDQAKAIFDAAAQASQPLRDQLRQAHQALASASQAGKSDAEIDQLAATVGTLTGQTAAIQAKAQAKFYGILTPDQKDKLSKLPQRGPGGPGGPGFGPPR